MTTVRVFLSILLATLVASPAWSREQNAPAAPAAPASPAPRPMRIRIGGNVQSPMLTHVVEPEYPAGAKVTGSVVLHAVIARDGTVMSLDHVSGDPLLTLAATEAAMQWRYKPILLNGQPVEVDTTISVVFALDKHGKLKPQPKQR